MKGTAFLSSPHKGRPAEQWLYLPELQRVRQITASARNEIFVGSDLSYHDLDLLQEMIGWSEADAGSSLRPGETLDGTPNDVIELTPIARTSATGGSCSGSATRTSCRAG